MDEAAGRTVLVADDHPLFRAALRRAIEEAVGGAQVIEAAGDGARLDVELALHRQQVDHEVVLLQAASEAALRRTHRRYFETASEIVRSTSAELKLGLSFAVGAPGSGHEGRTGTDGETGAREPRR